MITSAFTLLFLFFPFTDAQKFRRVAFYRSRAQHEALFLPPPRQGGEGGHVHLTPSPFEEEQFGGHPDIDPKLCKSRVGTNCTDKVNLREVVHRQEAFVPHREDEFEFQSAQWTKRVYPPKPLTTKALKRYQELPYPIIGGTSPYFIVLVMSILAFLFGKILGLLLKKTEKKVELNPELQEFPPMFIYSLQQTKREVKVMREVRNTWAWLSRRYVVREEDEKLDLRLFQTTWSDFEVPKDIWGVVRNALAVSV